MGEHGELFDFLIEPGRVDAVFLSQHKKLFMGGLDDPLPLRDQLLVQFFTRAKADKPAYRTWKTNP